MRASALGVTGSVLAAGLVFAAAPTEFSVTAFNGRYSQPGVSLDGVALGPLTLRMSSPENSVFIDSHTLLLSPLSDGSHRAELVAAVRGGGHLVADVEVAGTPSRLVDDVVLPPQTVTVEGRARLARVDGGYEITVLELPGTVGVDIESVLADRLVTVCEGLQWIALGVLDCAVVRRSLRHVQVPLPESGQSLFLADSQTSAAERRALDDYLTAGTQPR